MENSDGFLLKLKKPNSGNGYVFFTAIATAAIIFIQIAILVVIFVNGIGYYWPSKIQKFTTVNKKVFLGSVNSVTKNKSTGKDALQIKIANRDFYGLDYKRLDVDKITKTETFRNVVVIERLEYGDFFGFFGKDEAEATQNMEFYRKSLPKISVLRERSDKLRKEIKTFNFEDQTLRYNLIQEKKKNSPNVDKIETRLAEIQQKTDKLIKENGELIRKYTKAKIEVRDINDTVKKISIATISRIYFPNQIDFFQKFSIYFSKLIELVTENPREANTEGGIFPAIFGTVIMVFIMSIFSFPLGVIAAIYLRIYAKDSHFLKIVRIAVNNLAGIPSIVFGVFGLGFFIYGLGGSIDSIFFSERLPNPTFGTGGILWSSLTLGLLTVPVVIVATEEALSSIPQGIYDASVALGATKLQTLFRVLIPIASPGMLTGFILAMSRAAGEVAPLMITGVVKLTPSLVLDSVFPYIHLERKFMHLGFHIFDLGFQSPNVEAAKPMVYITTMLLIFIVVLMTAFAIYLREKLKQKYVFKSF